MALSSSLAVIIISFFLCFLAAHAVRDLPDQAFISITKHNCTDKLREEYTHVATVPTDGHKVQWEGSCFKTNHGWLELTDAYAAVRIYVEDGESTFCSDKYKFYTADGYYLDYMTIFKRGSHSDLLTVSRGELWDKIINKGGVAIYVDKSELKEPKEKEESELNFIKEVV